VSLGVLVLVAVMILGVSNVKPQQAATSPSPEMVKKGAYLVNLGGCNDCHSPKMMTQQGPMPDTALLLSGQRATANIPDVPAGAIAADKWLAITNNDMTAWAGPWGVSFAANLTPHNPTGLGAWSEETFIKTMRTGKHMGVGRDILPPMPWFNLATASDEDLKAIFAYLRSIKPVNNLVPAPMPPLQQK